MGRMANGWHCRTRTVVHAYPSKWARQPGYTTLDMVAEPRMPRDEYIVCGMGASWDDGDPSVDERFDMPPIEQHWRAGQRLTFFTPPTYRGVGAPDHRLVIRVGERGPYLHLRYMRNFVLERATPTWALDEEREA